MATSPEGGGSLNDWFKLAMAVWQGLAIPVAGAVWVAYKFITKRNDDKQIERDNVAKTQSDEAIREREMLSKDTLETIARKDRDIAARDAEIRNLQIKADRFSEAYHACNSARQAVWDIERAAGVPEEKFRKWPPWSWMSDTQK